jgi:hypothetical protein
MSLQLKISPRLIPSVASSYTDVNRIFMEYIDNSIDSAEEYFDQANNNYSKEVEIALTISSDKIFITDNCSGIPDLSKVVGQIGNSAKRDQPWTNGQFGYGVFSFLAHCDLLEILTKKNDEAFAQKISIPKGKFDTADQEDVSFDDPVNCDYENKSGTKITLSGFTKSTLKQINAAEIKGEIEKHFELLLGRKNLTIKIIDLKSNQEHICEQFNYELFEGATYEVSLNSVSFLDGRKSAGETIYPLSNPIKIYLKATKSTVINKPPVFVRKGRRVGEIKDIKQFKSAHKSDIWSHTNLTGYIDLVDFIDPTITRTDFKNDNKSKALFLTLLEHEDKILQLLKDINNTSDEQHYHKLEDFLNKALSKLARIDSINFRTEVLKGNDINLSPNDQEIDFNKEKLGEEYHRDGPRTGEPSKNTKGHGDDGDPLGDRERDNEDYESDSSGNEASPENPYEDSDFRGAEKKKPGFDIKLVEFDPPEDVSTGKQKRSVLNGGTIVVYKKHPDFEARVSQFRDGQLKITPRLITYLAGEITVHYKDKLQQKQGQAVYNVEMFENLVEFIYKFEDMISPLSGKNLSDLMDQEGNNED